jgi:PAS domain-containing protein
LLWLRFRRSTGLYRNQAALILVGALVPWVVNILYLSGLRPFAHLDLTPFAFIITGLAISSSMFRFHLLDIVPVARDRVVDLNPAAYQFIKKGPDSPIGQRAEIALPQWPEVLAHYFDTSENRLEFILEQNPPRHFDLQITPLHDRQGHLTGHLLIWHDITLRKQAETALQQAKEAAEEARRAAEAANEAKSAFLATNCVPLLMRLLGLPN